MILLPERLRVALSVNTGRQLAARRDDRPEPDPVPLLKLFNPVGSAIWLASELAEDGDTLFGLCEAQHKPNYVKPGDMLSWPQNVAGRFSFLGHALNITRMLRSSQDERNSKMSYANYRDDLRERVDAFMDHLRQQGYAEGTVLHYSHCCRHFAVWLADQRVALSSVDYEVVDRFATHHCTCPGAFRHGSQRNRSYVASIRRFARYLADLGLTPKSIWGEKSDNRLRPFREWLRQHRGTSDVTNLRHVHAISTLLPQLGNDPTRYDAALINRVILRNLEQASRASVQLMCGSLRMYLRFLSASGACPPALVGAVPRIPRWRLATLPRYILNDDVERVIASCDPGTARGLRDRAILLLLARLALRGGDVANLDLGDIDWDNALIRVAGKTRHAVALPLPQDAGDALLAYIEHARPIAASSKVFLRVIAPFVPFACSSPIATIVRDALARAGVDNANLRGAYLLRHSAATNMLRTGATLDAVGAVLRHRSPETTAIYAKVDTAMLGQIVQPWIGGASC
ncbi:tyrosine-type recombinase/integrase [Novosphingobium rosa]|uniref:tyrosine-type recombinase/integrase n=1 Tax=Novosphingobium rosa TaxID=76978 RepID=UPI000A0247C9|nr:tyrosine-type recombinase/integrase [Novosphingobium rosa]